MIKLPFTLKSVFAGAAFAVALASTSLHATPATDELNLDLPVGVSVGTATGFQLADAVGVAIGDGTSVVSAGDLVTAALTADSTNGVDSLYDAPQIVEAAAAAAADAAAITEITNAAFSTVNNPASTVDPAAVAAALTAGLAAGINDTVGLTSAEYDSKLAAMVTAATKQVIGVTGSALVDTYKPSKKKSSLKPALSTAGVVTGAISEVYAADVADTTVDLVATIVKAAVKASRADVFALVQAAATAGAYASGDPSTFDSSSIVAGALAGLKKSQRTQAEKKNLKLTAKFGIQEAVAGNLGAGAAGVANYAWINSNGSEVTNINGF